VSKIAQARTSQLKPKIGIILGTTRPTRFSEKAAQWLANIAKRRDDAEFEVVDLRDYPMPFFEEERSPMLAPPKSAIALRWGKKMAELDIPDASPTNAMVCASAFRRSFLSS
jgi:NADPH-dependent FMN reductase